MALALYRRYRPDTFEGVIGQDQVTVPLMRALDQGRLTHAYLFSGPRGCGKTSSARILARCVNCAQGPTSHPCGECESCKDLATGGPGSIDVVEIDAASHNGVDDARELRERAGFAPARDRYKIFILDEAHMVTQQGFNALLKIVEEPPEHVMFIFATTEPEKVIGTIRSRTHHYPFRLVPQEVMGPYLEEICEQEGIDPEPGVLRLAMRAGGGSMRDTLSVLDQLMVGAVDGEIAYDSAVALLGFTPETMIGEAIDAVIDGDGEALYGVVQKVVVGGFDPRRFVEDLLSRVRDLLVLSLGGDHAERVLSDDAAAEDMDALHRQAAALGLPQLTAMAEIINDALSSMSGATSPRMRLELLAARLLAGREHGFVNTGAASADGVGATGAATNAGASGSGASAGAGGTQSGRPRRGGGFIGAQRNQNNANMTGQPGHSDSNSGGAATREQTPTSEPGASAQSTGWPSESAEQSPAAAQSATAQTAGHTAAQPAAQSVAAQPIVQQPAGTWPEAEAQPNAAQQRTAQPTAQPSANAAAQRHSVQQPGQPAATPAAPARDTRTVDQKWDAVVAALPQEIREYVDRGKVPTVSYAVNAAGKGRLSMTFDSALSQHAFSLAVATDEEHSGKKAANVVLDAVRGTFGANTMIAPTSVAANGEHVIPFRRMPAEQQAQVKAQIAMAKAGLAAANLSHAVGDRASDESKTPKTGDSGAADADEADHRPSASPVVPGATAAERNDDPWKQQGASSNGAEPRANVTPPAEHQRRHVPVPDLSDDTDPWAPANDAARRQSPQTSQPVQPSQSAPATQTDRTAPTVQPMQSAQTASTRTGAAAHGGAESNTPGVMDDDPWAQPLDDAAARRMISAAGNTAGNTTGNANAGSAGAPDDADPWASPQHATVPMQPTSPANTNAPTGGVAGTAAADIMNDDDPWAQPLSTAQLAVNRPQSGAAPQPQHAGQHPHVRHFIDTPRAADAQGPWADDGSSPSAHRPGADGFSQASQHAGFANGFGAGNNAGEAGGNGGGNGNAGRQSGAVDPDDDEYSMSDESLGTATALSVEELSKMFDVKKIEEFAPDDPKNPRNVQPAKHIS